MVSITVLDPITGGQRLWEAHHQRVVDNVDSEGLAAAASRRVDLLNLLRLSGRSDLLIFGCHLLC